MLTPVTGIAAVAGVGTVTETEAVRFPSTVVTVIAAVPGAIAVTRPFVLTVAIAGLLEAHVTVWFVAFTGASVAVSVLVAATSNWKLLAGAMFTPVTGITIASHWAYR